MNHLYLNIEENGLMLTYKVSYPIHDEAEGLVWACPEDLASRLTPEIKEYHESVVLESQDFDNVADMIESLDGGAYKVENVTGLYHGPIHGEFFLYPRFKMFHGTRQEIEYFDKPEFYITYPILKACRRLYIPRIEGDKLIIKKLATMYGPEEEFTFWIPPEVRDLLEHPPEDDYTFSLIFSSQAISFF